MIAELLGRVVQCLECFTKRTLGNLEQSLGLGIDLRRSDRAERQTDVTVVVIVWAWLLGWSLFCRVRMAWSLVARMRNRRLIVVGEVVECANDTRSMQGKEED